MVEKAINKEAFRRTLTAVWGLIEAVGFHEIGDKLHIIQFKKRADLKRIWDGRPWAFDLNLLELQHYEMRLTHEVFWVQMHTLPLGCMTRGLGQYIGESIGVVEKVDVNNIMKEWCRESS